MFYALILLTLSTPSSLACPMKKPLTEEVKSRAEIVFIGKAIAYTPRPKFNPKSRQSRRPAIIRFQVEKVLSGPEQNEYEVYWINGTFGQSLSLEDFIKGYGSRTRVGITNSYKHKGFEDRPWVVQDPCTPPYMREEKP
jgi:hypothetical protein